MLQFQDKLGRLRLATDLLAEKQEDEMGKDYRPSNQKKQEEIMKHHGKNFIPFLVIILLLGVWACEKVTEDDHEPFEKFSQELLADLNRSALQLTGSDPTLPDDELAPLADLGQALVVGLGEATHGTHEFFAMKHRLFRYLVERFDFRALAFECDYDQSIYFDRWLNGGAGGVAHDLMRIGTWRPVEVTALLEWMRQVNLTRPEAERLHFVGVDCQFATYQPDLLREYLQHVSPQHLAEIEALLVREEAFRDADFKNLTTEQYQSLWRELESEYQAWASLKKDFVALSSTREFEVARQLLRSLIQVNQVSFESSTSTNYRDFHMAENTLWAQKQFCGGRGIALWAHNLHVANDFAGIWPVSTGYHLRQALGKRYVIVGFSFCQGSFTAVGYDPVNKVYTGLQTHSIDEAPLPYSVNDLFFAAEKKMFFLRLDRLVKGDPLQVWFNQGRKMLNITVSYNGNPAKYYWIPFFIPPCYDVLIHFDRTTFAAQL